MKFKTKYTIVLWKGYFDKGISLTNYFKYFIALYALATQDLKNTLIFGVAYAFFCLALGIWWYKSDFIKAELEVSNRFNIFVEEMRAIIANKGKRDPYKY